MRSYHRDSCNWSSSSNQVCLLSALTWKLSDEHHWSFATPRENGGTRCRKIWSVARVYDHPCCQSWNYQIHQHTHPSYSSDDEIWCRYTPGLLPPGSEVDAWHLLAAFDTLCVGFGLRTLPSTHSATGKWYLLSTRRESMNSKHSALDSKRWGSHSSAILSLADWINWGITISTCAQTWYRFEHVISNVGRCFSIPLWRSPSWMPQMLWTNVVLLNWCVPVRLYYLPV